MDNTMLYFIALGTLLILMYAIYIYRLSKKYKQKKNDIETAVISGQRERIESDLYNLRKLMVSSPERFFDTNKLLLEVPDKEITINGKVPNYSFFKNLGIDINTIEQKDNTVFCIMPFNKSFLKTYDVIREVCEKAGFECTRSDTPYNPGNLLRQIVSQIIKSQIIIAVLDGQNPNVFYEIGLAQSIGKPVLLLANLSRNESIPFDLRSDRLLLYSNYSELNDFLYVALKNVHYVE